MKYSILLSLTLSGWIAFFYSHRVFLIRQFPKFPIISNQNFRHNMQLQKIESEFKTKETPVKQELYNSISTGMTYEEVRSIIGWDGNLIYENNIDYADRKIYEKIYQWNSQDIDFIDYESRNIGVTNLYWSVILQFQDGILINKSSFNLAP
jgi:hypothetical protein